MRGPCARAGRMKREGASRAGGANAERWHPRPTLRSQARAREGKGMVQVRATRCKSAGAWVGFEEKLTVFGEIGEWGKGDGEGVSF